MIYLRQKMNSTSTKAYTNDYESPESNSIFEICKRKKTKRLLRNIEIPPFNIDSDVKREEKTLPKIKFSFFEHFAANDQRCKYTIKSSLF